VPTEGNDVCVGFLGAGLIATFHSKMLRASGVPVVRSAVYDPDRERAEAFARASRCSVADSEEEVLDGSDAVYVCTWTSEHPRLVEAAAARGLAVFCEKPLGVDLTTAASMTATLEAAGVTNQVGLVLRRSPAFLAARELVTDPAAGRVVSVVFRDDQYLPVQGTYGSDWRADRHRAGAGTLLEHSIHDVDLLAMLIGEIDTVSAQQAFVHGIDGIEDVVAVSIRFGSGALGTLLSVWHDNLARPSSRRVEIFCERRHVVVDGHDWFGPVTWTDSDGTTGHLDGEALVARVVAPGAAHPLARSTNPDGDFVLAAADHAPAYPDAAVALRAHRVVDAIYRSATAGGVPVTVTGT
jgi:predicted dehydrogenase